MNPSTLTQTPAPLDDDTQFQTALGQYTELHDKCARISTLLTEHRKLKTELNTKLCEYWERKQWQQRAIALHAGDQDNGSLHYATENQRPPLSQTFLSTTLPAYFAWEAANPQVAASDPKARTDALLHFLSERRTPVPKATIKRKYPKTATPAPPPGGSGAADGRQA